MLNIVNSLNTSMKRIWYVKKKKLM